MIQKGSRLNVVDNSGAKIAYCIQNVSHPGCRYAYIGDLLLLSIKKLRVKRRYASKIKNLPCKSCHITRKVFRQYVLIKLLL